MGNKKRHRFLCLRRVPFFAYVGAEDNRKGILFVKIVSLLRKLIQFLMVALSVAVHKALILLVFFNHPYQSLAFYRFFVKADAFRATDACIGCGKCVELCPLNNIRLENGKPVWGKNCTHCMACICHCPKEAIEYGKKSKGKPRYHFEALEKQQDV